MIKRNNSKSNLNMIKKIVRIKNGFKHMLKWTNISQFSYCDLKLNVYLCDSNGNELIAEIQFLLSFMLVLKQMQHSTYSLLRRREFIDGVTNLLYFGNINTENESMKISNPTKHLRNIKKVSTMIENRDFGQFSNEILLSNSKSIFYINNKIPLLYELNRQSWIKASKLLLSSLIHYNFHINDNGSSNGQFVANYFNYSDNSSSSLASSSSTASTGIALTFYGINLKSLSKNKHDSHHSLIKGILKSKYFDEIKDEMIVYNCVLNDCFEYLWLLKQNRSNDKGIVNGINFWHERKTNGFTPLTKLLTSKHCSQRWIQLLLSFDNVDIHLPCRNKDPNYFGAMPLNLVGDKDEWKKLLINHMKMRSDA